MGKIIAYRRENRPLPQDLLLMYRQRGGFTQNRLAALLGLKSDRMLQKWEGGSSLPPAPRLKNLIQFYLQWEVFVVGKEYQEASRLWNCVKEMHDQNSSSLEYYPIFDEGWFEQLLNRSHLSSNAIGTTHSIPESVPPTQLFPGSLSAKRLEVSHNLPIQLTSFIGREREISEIKERLTQHRLLTLIGAGGVGKSRLSLQVATELLEDFEAGVWLVELAALSDHNLIPKTLATVLKITEQPGHPLLETISNNVGPKQLLLVLDNCEHLVEAVAQLSETLLRACPNLRILASSRESLDVAGETTYRVPSLSLPDLNSPPNIESLRLFEATRLFIERAKANRPDFTFTNQNALALTQICITLDGIPLAIELAAARVKTLSLEQIALRLTDRFQLLTTGNRTALTRHQTLRALIDWSYNLLSESEQSLWQRLTVFVGGWDLENAEKVCGGDGVRVEEILDLLNQLVNKSLVIVEEKEAIVRFRFLETIRQYGLEKLTENGGLEALQKKHAEYYAEWIKQLGPKLKGAEQHQAEILVDRDYPNVLAAIKWAIANQNSRIALAIEAELGFYVYTRGFYTQQRQLLTEILALPVPDVFEQLRNRADCLMMLGNLSGRQGDNSSPNKLFPEALATFRAIGDKEGTAVVLGFLALAATNQAEHERVPEYVKEALEIYRELNDPVNASDTMFLWNVLGMSEIQQGQYALARQHLEEALAYKEIVGNKHRRYRITLYHLTIALVAQGEYALAQGYLTELLSGVREELHHNSDIGDLLALATFFASGLAESTTSLAKSQAYLKRAAHLAGATDVLIASLGIKMSLPERDFYNRAHTTIQTELGEVTFKAAYAEGQALSPSEAVDYALTTEETQIVETAPAAISNPVCENPDKLTTRELEVLRLVAEGLTDPQIAEKLTLSPRTVNAHLRTIFGKLGLATRSAATRYAIENKLA